ncbi:hypothetical protein V1264_023600 [Littorina saxatilis]
MAKYRTRVFLQPVSTSSCFEEALRLCRHDDDTNNSAGRRNKEKDKDKDKEKDKADYNEQDEQGAQLQHLELRTVHPSFPDPAQVPPRQRPFTPTTPSCTSTRISLETITVETSARSPSRSSLRPSSRSSSRPSSRWTSVRPFSGRRLSEPLRVQWADEQEQDLESFPRRRYDSRNPSIRYDPPRPILKQP